MATYKDIIEKAKKEWNCPGLMDGAKAARGKRLPFSSPMMNWVTYGGIPRDRITEFFGAPGSGKSTSAIDICKNAISIFQDEYDFECLQLKGKINNGDKASKSELVDLEDRGVKKILYIDLEHSFDAAWSATLGIDETKIDIMQPPDVVAEDILQMVEDLVETGEIGLLVLDSIPSLIPRAELEKNYGERTVAALAGLLTIFCRKIVPKLDRYDTTMIFINQIRDNLNNPYVVRTPGGEAPKFYASLRMLFEIGKPIDIFGNELPMSSENPAGYIVNAKIKKQKSAPNDRKVGSYYLLCQSGIRIDMDYANLAITKYGIIKKSGGWYTMFDPLTGEMVEDEDGKIVKVNGMLRVYEYFNSNPKYFNKVRTYILNDIENLPQDTERYSECEDDEYDE